MHESSLFCDISQDSRLPTSTLRSTASPYKRVQNPSVFKAYLSQLDKGQLIFPLKIEGAELLSKSSINASSQNISQSSDLYECHNDNDAKLDLENASIASSDICAEPLASSSPAPSSPISSIAIDTLSCPDLYSDDTVDFPDDLSERISHSYPNPFDYEDDAATESDHSIEPIISSRFSLPSTSRSPFSSPLSSAPSSPVATRKVLAESKPRNASRKSLNDKIRDPSRSKSSTNKKRSRSPSPIPGTSKRGQAKKRRGDPKTSTNIPEENSENQSQKRASSATAHTAPPFAPLHSSDELIGPLAQILALSMRSSLTTSSLVHELLISLPFLRKDRTLDEFTAVVVNTMSNTSVFGRAQSNGVKNADDKEVEDEWFYRPEQDKDESRREFLSEFQRGGGKRRATQQKKQYYWKPVR